MEGQCCFLLDHHNFPAGFQSSQLPGCCQTNDTSANNRGVKYDHESASPKIADPSSVYFPKAQEPGGSAKYEAVGIAYCDSRSFSIQNGTA
jgi:hypothetical protein